MYKLKHGFKIDMDRCRGRMDCMRACPTQAIRVKNGKASLISELCIDCGSCLAVCSSGAISATTITFSEIGRFKFKVAVASPALFTQFGPSDTPTQVTRILLSLGFDAVWQYAVDIELIERAITECVKKWPGPFPLISSSCPVIVRLVQVAYPSMVDHLIPIEAPREIAGRELKRRYSAELDLNPGEIAAIYISPCQAKTISILQPAEEVKSYLDGSVGISQIYSDILSRLRKKTIQEDVSLGSLTAGDQFYWGAPEGEFPNLSKEHYLPLSGLSDIMKVFNDIEKGRIGKIEFLECYACPGGCIGGNLTVENIYLARNKYLRFSDTLQKPSSAFEREIERRYAGENFSLRRPLKPRQIEREDVDLRERISRRKTADELLKGLPLLNCGLCGAPTCRNHAEDVAGFRAELRECIFLSQERINELRKIYKR